jgi:hypothetical protein
MKNYVGRKIRGFEFGDGTNGVRWNTNKKLYIGEIGEITYQDSRRARIKFSDDRFDYPISLIEPHLIEEETPEIPQLGEGVSGWVDVKHALPKALETVWLTNGKGWCCLGCLIEDAEGCHWGESNGVIYIENGEIVSECESEDLDVKFWHKVPKMRLTQLPKYTHAELVEKLGHDFEINK